MRLAVITATPDAAGSLHRLAAIPGLDVEHGLRMTGGKETSYVRLLGMFAETHGEDAGLLSAALAAGDLVTLKQLAHSLKGAAGTLGAVQVAAAATALDALCATLCTGMTALIDGIHRQ
jgi:HPt (histidine-containing phosphotransfer) domain-containing protein